MSKKLNALMAAVALVAAGGANAAATNAQENLGNSSVLFVALDRNSNASVVVDLGLNMSDFTNTGVTDTTWNFATNTTTLSTTGNDWSTAYETFKSIQAGGDYLWGVIAADSISGASVSATNAIAGRGMLATGNATQAQMLAASTSSPTGSALGNFQNWLADARLEGTLTSANNGAGFVDSTMGVGYVGSSIMNGTFGGLLTWNFLVADGATSTFQWQQQSVANPVIYQFGLNGTGNATDALAASPMTFSFDIATDTLTLVATVPEPGTYGLMLAGLAAVGFIARRRRA